jgi:hypothetical protein
VIAAAIAAGIGAVSALIGEFMANGREEEARELMREAARAYNVPLPDFETVIAEQLGPSAMGGVQADSQAVAAQRAALQRLSELSSGGPDAQYDASLQDAMSSAGNFASRQMAGARDSLAARGTLGGGQEAALSAVAAQEGANRAARGATSAAAERQRRAYEALRDGASLGGQVRGQGFDEDSRKAAARDAIERQNAMLRTDATTQRNANAQRQFQNRYDVARGKANSLAGQATQARQDAADTRQAAAGYGAAAGQAVGAIGGAMQGQQQSEDERQRQYRQFNT